MNASLESGTKASAWGMEFCRLIAFPTDPPLFTDQHWWEELVGEHPEDFVTTRKKHAYEARGSFKEAVLSLTIDLRNVIWLVEPSSDTSQGAIPTLGPFREKTNWLVDFLSPWLAKACPPIRRLAFVGKLIHAADTAQEAYQFLAERLPAISLEPNPNDFLLQINRRKSSSVVGGLSLNRVSTWSKMNAPLSIEPGQPFKWPDNCFAALELDINTAPERGELLPKNLLPELFRELASIGVSIAEKGDVLE